MYIYVHLHVNSTPILFLRYTHSSFFRSIRNNPTSTALIHRFFYCIDPGIYRNNGRIVWSYKKIKQPSHPFFEHSEEVMD